MSTVKSNIFRGDDLVDVIRVDRPGNTAQITITLSEIQVGPLHYEQANPVFPYYITIPRLDSVYLNLENDVYHRITYANGTVRRTCLGKLTLVANEQVVFGDNEQQ